MSRSEKRKKAAELHKQFSHAPKDKLCKLVKDSLESNDKEIINGYCESCDLCQVPASTIKTYIILTR